MMCSVAAITAAVDAMPVVAVLPMQLDPHAAESVVIASSATPKKAARVRGMQVAREPNLDSMQARIFVSPTWIARSANFYPTTIRQRHLIQTMSSFGHTAVKSLFQYLRLS